MAISLNNKSNFGGISSGSPQSIGFTTVGNLLVLLINSSTAVVTGVTDSQGNSYISAGPEIDVATYGNELTVWYAKGATAGATTVTVTFTGGGGVSFEFYDCVGAHPTNPLQNYSVWQNVDPLHHNITPTGPTCSYTQGGGIGLSIVVASSIINGIGSPWVSALNGFDNGYAHVIASSAGTYAPAWILNSTPGHFWGISVFFASVLETTFTNIRAVVSNSVVSANTSTTTFPVNTNIGDLVIVVGSDDPALVGTRSVSDSLSNIWSPVTGMTPYHSGNSYNVYVAYCVLQSAGAGQTFTYHYPSDGGPVCYAFVVTPTSSGVTLTSFNTGTTSSSVTTFTNASCTASAGSLLLAYVALNGADQTSYTANASWLLGQYVFQNTDIDGGCMEFQLNASSGATTDNFTVSNATSSTEIILAFTLPSGAPIQGYGAAVQDDMIWLGGDDN